MRTYNWTLWGFLVMILFAQVFGVVMTVVSSEQHAYYGRDPLDGPSAISSYNDEPYADRIVACVLHGRQYKPTQVSAMLRSSTKAVVDDATGTSVRGYRISTRKSEMVFDTASMTKYKPLCSAISATLDAFGVSCAALGYNVTRDALRVVSGVDSSVTTLLRSSLPVLILPYWDNSYASRFVIPGVDGSACVFRLSGGPIGVTQYLHGINRTTREALTAAWLGRPGGVWRNGWYEDLDGDKWFSDLISTNRDYMHSGLVQRMFDTERGGVEVDWRSASSPPAAIDQTWGGSLTISEHEVWYNSVTISNGARYGLFLYEALKTTYVQSQYGIDIFVSNVCLILVLLQWLIAIIALQRGERRDQSGRAAVAGVGCLGAQWQFAVLPIALLPRLKTTLAAFFAVGCQFEGEQRALAEAWFVVYPAVGECLMYYYSLLNLLAKVLRRRVSDALFGPTLAFFYVLHFFRFELAQSQWLEFDGRVTTVVTSVEFDKLSLLDLLTTDAALRMNGNVQSLFVVKVAVLALNVAPLLWSRSTRRRAVSTHVLGVEAAVAIRAATVGGLGRPFEYSVVQTNTGATTTTATTTPDSTDARTKQDALLLPRYELIRIGYLVLGDAYVVAMKDWLWLVLVSPLRCYLPFANTRVCVFALTHGSDNVRRVHSQPRYVAVSDAELRDVSCWDVSARAVA